jgi:dynein heavy chain
MLVKLGSCLRLNDAYQEQYRLTKDKLMQQPKVKQFDLNESQIFGKFDLYCKRVQKLIDMFQTIDQFRSLSQHQVEGMENLIEKFFKIADDFKKKPYDLLDFTKNVFDRDFLEFNVNVAELETALQGFINASFENITSTEHALALLRQQRGAAPLGALRRRRAGQASARAAEDAPWHSSPPRRPPSSSCAAGSRACP